MMCEQFCSKASNGVCVWSFVCVCVCPVPSKVLCMQFLVWVFAVSLKAACCRCFCCCVVVFVVAAVAMCFDGVVALVSLGAMCRPMVHRRTAYCITTNVE